MENYKEDNGIGLTYMDLTTDMTNEVWRILHLSTTQLGRDTIVFYL